MEFIKDYDFMPRDFMISEFGPIFCKIFPKICNDLVGTITDMNPSYDNYDVYDILAGHAPSGTSI